MISELERTHRVQLFLRCLVWALAIACLVILAPGCKTLRNAPADAVLVGGTTGSTLAATAIGGPAGLAVGVAGTLASVMVTEELVRPATTPPLAGGIADAVVGVVPGGKAVSPPWFLSPGYWWGIVFLTLGASALLKFAFSSRFREHILHAIRCAAAGKIKAALGHLLAAGGLIHTETVEGMKGSGG